MRAGACTLCRAAWLAIVLVATGIFGATAQARAISVVAAQNVYGDIVRQIGGPNVAVDDLIQNPNLDPHEFEASAATARKVADAEIVVYNGVDYDPWMVKLLKASASSRRQVLEVGSVARRAAGVNPHLWYDLDAVAAFARAVAATLARVDAANAPDYSNNLNRFENVLTLIRDRIAYIRKRQQGAPVAATEPVFDYMAAALGLRMRNQRFALAVMNQTEPGARDVASFESDLKSRAVKVVLFNPQRGGPLIDRLLQLAHANGVRTVAVTETLPAGQSYQQWMLAQLDAVDRAIDKR